MHYKFNVEGDDAVNRGPELAAALCELVGNLAGDDAFARITRMIRPFEHHGFQMRVDVVSSQAMYDNISRDEGFCMFINSIVNTEEGLDL